MGKIMMSKYEHLMLPGAFLDKVSPYIETVAQCDVPVVKILL